MSKDHREALLEAGVSVVQARGFGATGVRDIATAAGVPQGSFTNYFRSKEVFGILLLDRYVERLDAIMAETLFDDRLTPSERLRAYFRRIADKAAEADWRRGCIVPDLAAEIGAHGDALRARLCEVLERQSAQFEAVVRLFYQDDDEAAADLGAFILAAWHGTLIRMKAEQNSAPLERFAKVLERFVPSDNG